MENVNFVVNKSPIFSCIEVGLITEGVVIWLPSLPVKLVVSSRAGTSPVYQLITVGIWFLVLSLFLLRT